MKDQGDINFSEERHKYHEQLNEETQYWINKDADYFFHQALSTPVMNVLSKTEGAYIYDLNGKKYLDLHGNGVHNIGFNNPEVVAAVMKQLQDSLAFTPRRYTNKPAVNFAEKLVEVTPKGLDRVLFCPGGSEAIETAVMLAKQITGKWKTISYWESYHGNGFQAASVGGQEHFKVGNGPMVPGAMHIEFPNYYRNPWGFTNIEQIDEAYLRQLNIIIRNEPDIAALIAEPISATPVVPSEYYWQQVRQICDENDILLIFDEIIEGFGRTGKLFACEHYVTPDILVLGKTMGGGLLPFAGIVTKDRYNYLSDRSVGHFTHEKNPLCSAAGLAMLNYMESHQIVAHVAKTGAYLMEKLNELKDEFNMVGNVAGKGFHLGVELIKNDDKERAFDSAERIMYDCIEMGLAFKLIEGNVITLRPSLIIGQEECDFIADTLRKAIQNELALIGE